MLGLAAMPASMPARKRMRSGNILSRSEEAMLCGAAASAAHSGRIVSSSLKLMAPYKTAELTAAEKQRAASDARCVVRGIDKVLEKMLDVRVISTQRDGLIENHVNLRVANEYSCMVHHERALVGDADMMFCFMASSELEPVVVVVALHGDHGRLVQLSQEQFAVLEIALQQFRLKFGLEGELYSYTPLETRLSCSWHSRHFHLKIRVPTEMYLRIFPPMQVLGSNHVCKRAIVDTYKKLWEPLLYKFELKTQLTWTAVRDSVQVDLKEASVTTQS